MTEFAIFDRNELMERVGDDDELVEQLLDLFAEDYEARLNEIESGIETEDHSMVRKAAHTMKGSSGNLSLHRVYHSAKELENAASEARTTDYPALFNNLKTNVIEALQNIGRL